MTSIVGTGLEGYIKRTARERALHQLAEAEIQARRITEQAEHRAAAVRAQVEELAAEQAAVMRQRTEAQADLEAQSIRVRRREAVLETVWQEASEQLQRLSPQERLAAITALAQDAADQLGGGALLLRVNEGDRQLLDERALAELSQALASRGATSVTLDAQAAPISGGVIVIRQGSGAGSTGAQPLVDNSWDERLRLSFESLREEIFEFLGRPADSPALD